MHSLLFYLVLFMALTTGCKKTPNNPAIQREVGSSEDNIYIPKNLEECFSELKKKLKPEDIKKIKKGTEDDIAQYHFSIGQWMRNDWGLWNGSELSKWFNDQGIYHPDDMSGIILTSFWRHLNETPIELDKQIKFCQDYWKAQKSEK